MKLDPPDREIPVADAHDFTLLGLSRDFQTVREGVRFDHKRVVACGIDGTWNSLEEILAIMDDRGNLSMHQSVVDDHLCPKAVTNALVAKAHSQKRQFSGISPNDIIRKARLSG